MRLGEFLLVAVLAVPALGAVAVAAIRPDRVARMVGTVVAALTLLAALPLVADRDGGWFGYGATAPAVRPWHQVDLAWVPGLDLRFHLGVDGISWPLVVLTALLTLLCCGYTLWRVPEGGSGRALVALLLVVEVGILGTFLALDLVLFFVFFEVVLLPMYAVIAFWGGPDRRRAARKFALYTLFGSVLLLVGVYVVVAAAGTADIVALTGGAELSRGTQLAAFTLLALAFAVKSPLWPLHSWLPDAHSQAPTVGSVVLAGVLLKMGTYGLIRVAVGIAPEGARWAAPVLGVLAVAAIVVGSLVCLAQTELKRLIAYSSVGHMGFVLLGVATLTTTGIQAALIGNVAHGVITGLLFFLAGAVKDRTGTGELADLSGLRETAPRLAGLLGFAAVASLGLPGLAGFWGEAFAVVAAVEVGGPLWTTLAVLAAFGGALTAAYFLRLLRRVTHGRPSPVVGRLTPGLAGAELAAWVPLVLLALAVGLVPTLVLGVAEGPVDALVEVLR
ncbi:complex I subunit 4 family protein [Micromonospora endolithica]|uniref:NADH-quinone oxidoreductase subunit M n=1 Tax=Micromonospora endolithica TaxID=230091 RepID=A0A3A9Z7N8_9ACTN|nr:NADH-quinone oxidoreductase subunit M [Micromonospora endolithica]RKN44290.1 NADH-quinone oxidoreductase subunit M [Micromonospora endolithica]TWJ25765.1 NADH dehydrogenase subunit M [Micromonospora endolithica]